MPSLANLDFGEMIATARNDNFQAFKILTIIFSISYRLLLASRSRGLYGKVYRNNRASEPALRLFMLSPRAELFSVGCALSNPTELKSARTKPSVARFRSSHAIEARSNPNADRDAAERATIPVIINVTETASIHSMSRTEILT